LTLQPLVPSRCYEASRPLFVEHADEPQFRFTKRGSAFLCEFRDRSYAVLARHTLATYTRDQARIPVHDGFNEFFTYDYHWEPRGVDDCHDLLLLRLTTTANIGDWLAARARVTEKTPELASAGFVLGGDLVVSCYPGIGLNEVDYERDTITNQRFIVQCEYSGATDEHVHQLKVRQSATIADFGGYSGGIVIARTATGLVPAGVVITGSAQANLIRFVDVTALFLSLDNFAAQVNAA